MSIEEVKWVELYKRGYMAPGRGHNERRFNRSLRGRIRYIVTCVVSCVLHVHFSRRRSPTLGQRVAVSVAYVRSV